MTTDKQRQYIKQWYHNMLPAKRKKLNRKINQLGEQRKTRQRNRAIKLLGGCCQKCGYNRYYGALEFHHLDPDVKESDISHMWKGSWKKLEKEIKKCMLLCSCCHREEHAILRGEWKNDNS